MDCISKLCDELLLKILSLLPTANDVVARMVLSKRWQFLWTMVPKLVYDDSYQNIEYARFSRFVDRSLSMHDAPVIETLHFILSKTCGPDDIRVWIRTADKRCLRELILEHNISSGVSWFILPRNFYTGCRILVTLNLSYVTLLDFSSPISFPSLKTLILVSVDFPSEEFFQRFLSNCPVLEDLNLDTFEADNDSICTIRVPSLKSLTVEYAHGLLIDAPSLVRLKITDMTNGLCVIENEMPMIATVDVTSTRSNLGKILGLVTSVKHLFLCLSSAKDPYPVGSVFHQLVSLKLRICSVHWLNLLMSILKGSPKLRRLKLNQCSIFRKPNPCWIKPSSVPVCLQSSLETLVFERYDGADKEKEVVEYILRNGACLKNVTISSNTNDIFRKHEMLKELAFSSRPSPTCQLTFK